MPLSHSDKGLGVVFGFNCQFNRCKHHPGKEFQMIVMERPVGVSVGDYLEHLHEGGKTHSTVGSTYIRK